MHDLRPDDDDQREGEGRPNHTQRGVLGQVVGDLLGPLAGPVVVQSCGVDALRRREVDGREIRTREGSRAKSPVRTGFELVPLLSGQQPSLWLD